MMEVGLDQRMVEVYTQRVADKAQKVVLNARDAAPGKGKAEHSEQ